MIYKSLFAFDRTGEWPPRLLEVVKWAVNAYAHLIPEGKKVTFKELADLIREVYDLSNPRNLAAVEALRDAQTIEDWSQRGIEHS